MFQNPPTNRPLILSNDVGLLLNRSTETKVNSATTCRWVLFRDRIVTPINQSIHHCSGTP
ncbi:hypothetical protein [Picosynechococcus sp. PCC 7003]|uniref:hypothetical protein n=1 Tax=Picosynechococcus sp. PCC 7003 TaxID=374981 RepID=UPI0012EED5A5|nr:hypothetical protein [Picosynechococcus sp. PCC 7003]